SCRLIRSAPIRKLALASIATATPTITRTDSLIPMVGTAHVLQMRRQRRCAQVQKLRPGLERLRKREQPSSGCLGGWRPSTRPCSLPMVSRARKKRLPTRPSVKFEKGRRPLLVLLVSEANWLGVRGKETKIGKH